MHPKAKNLHLTEQNSFSSTPIEKGGKYLAHKLSPLHKHPQQNINDMQKFSKLTPQCEKKNYLQVYADNKCLYQTAHMGMAD